MSSELEIELSNQLLAFKETIEATIKPFIEIKAKADNNLRLSQSKFGGFPYLPKNYQYPKDASGQYLSLLAQINFAETPKLEKFPERGILQFYISGGDDSDHLYGSSFDELTKQDRKNGLTVCVTRAGAERRRSRPLRKKLRRGKCLKTRRLPSVECTLC